VSLSDRAAALKRYQEQIKLREEQLALQISREVGKPLWESKTEVASMVSKIDITIQHGQKLISDYEIPNIMGSAQDGVLGACRYRPHGVMAVIGPFNFPGHLPNGHIVPALLAGNTVVFKPSETHNDNCSEAL
jgi:succinylglutamic semialdehyde dehydrogenase